MTTAMNAAQARTVDPLLTEVARGYQSRFSPVADALFPIVPVGVRGGQIVKFGVESFKLVNSQRAPGENTKRLERGYSKETFALVDYSLEAKVPIELQEEAQAVPGLNLLAATLRTVQDQMAREREKEAADLARNPALYSAGNKITLAGVSQWSDPANTDVFAKMNTAKEVVRSKIGDYPNTLVLPPLVLSALRNHPQIMGRFSNNAQKNPATIQQLQDLFEIEYVIAAPATYHDTAFVDIWGKDAILAYVNVSSLADMGSASFGYTYQLRGRPFAEQAYYDNNAKSWLAPWTDARQPVISGVDGGYLFTNAVA
jgi:hypothetical protein